MNDRKPYGQTMRGIAKKDDKILVVKRHPNHATTLSNGNCLEESVKRTNISTKHS